MKKLICGLIVGIVLGGILLSGVEAKPKKFKNVTAKADKDASTAYDTVDVTSTPWQGNFSDLSKGDQDLLINDIKFMLTSVKSTTEEKVKKDKDK